MVTGVHYLLRYEPELGPTARQVLDRVNGAGQRLRKLLDELDDAVWIEGGSRAALIFEPCRVDALVEGALGRLTQAITSREVTLDVRVPEDLPPFEADIKLCGTAIEYVLDFSLCRSRSKTVHIAAAPVDGVPVLWIADEGGAVDEVALGRLLDPFVEREMVPRPEPGQRRRERLGLGLSIARGILAAHGGALRAEIAEGGAGIAFWCTLGRPGSAVEIRGPGPGSPSKPQKAG